MDGSLILTAPTAMTAPLPDTPVLRLRGERYTFRSDTFTGAAATTLAGRTSDARLGGDREIWNTSQPAAFGTDGTRLVPGATDADSFASLTRPPGVVEVSAVVSTLPVGGKIWLVAARDAVAGPTNQVRADIDPDG